MLDAAVHALARLEAARQFALLESRAERLPYVQSQTLLRKIRASADSDFGRLHHFHEIRSVHDFRRNVPLSTYDDFKPFVRKALAGDTRALFGPADRIRFVALTSGSTQYSKDIPVTDTSLRERRRSWLAWGAFAWRDHPAAFTGGLLQVIGHARPPRLPDSPGQAQLAVECGSISRLVASFQPSFVRSKYLLPDLVTHTTHGPTKYYLALRFAATRNVTFFSTVNPQTFLAVARAGIDHHEQLIRDVRDGDVTCFDSSHNPSPLRDRLLRAAVKPDPEGARRLEDIRRRSDRLLPRDLWPNLALLACLKGGSLINFLHNVPEFYGDVPVRNVGLIANEGRMTLPTSSQGVAAPLDLFGPFFEFIPLENADDPSPHTLLPHQLERDRSYVIVLTTSAGLYRYNIKDVVKVVDFLHRAPVLEFLHRTSGSASLTGEKLTEYNVVVAVRAASPPNRPVIDTFTFVPQLDRIPFYTLLIEEHVLPAPEREPFLLRLDLALSRSNICYERERNFGHLHPPRLLCIPTGAWRRFHALTVRRNRGLPDQFKHPFLTPDTEFIRKLHTDLRIPRPTTDA